MRTLGLWEQAIEFISCAALQILQQRRPEIWWDIAFNRESWRLDDMQERKSRAKCTREGCGILKCLFGERREIGGSQDMSDLHLNTSPPIGLNLVVTEITVLFI